MTNPTLIAVTIVHPDPFARGCIAAALAAHPDLVVLDELACPEEVGPASPGVVVADFASAMRLAPHAPAAGGRQKSSCAIVIVSDNDREWELRSALSRHVRGFVAPGFSFEQLADSVRAVHRGARYLCTRAAARLAESLSFEALTDREREVLALVVDGLCNKSIGKSLAISNGTVKSHLKSTYAKLNVLSRTQAIAVAERRGLLERGAAGGAWPDAMPRPAAPAAPAIPASLPGQRLAHAHTHSHSHESNFAGAH